MKTKKKKDLPKTGLRSDLEEALLAYAAPASDPFS